MASGSPIGRWEGRLSRWGAPVTYVGAVVTVGLILVAVITRSPDTKANYQESADPYSRTALASIGVSAPYLGLHQDPLELAASINLRDIAASMSDAKDAALVVIDSIQTMWMEGVESAPGSVSQVRASAFELIRVAKQQNTALVLVGHEVVSGVQRPVVYRAALD